MSEDEFNSLESEMTSNSDESDDKLVLALRSPALVIEVDDEGELLQEKFQHLNSILDLQVRKCSINAGAVGRTVNSRLNKTARLASVQNLSKGETTYSS